MTNIKKILEEYGQKYYYARLSLNINGDTNRFIEEVTKAKNEAATQIKELKNE